MSNSILPSASYTLSFPIGTSLSDISEIMKCECGAEDMVHMVDDDI